MSIEPEDLVDEEAEPEPPIAHLRIAYTGPVAPHWELTAIYGDDAFVTDFWQRAIARLQLLPPHDPQFRRNRERVNRDAERENVYLEWDLGYDEEESEGTSSLGDKPAAVAAEVPDAPEAPTP
ncbi:MAG TPA: hypothetical protein VI916_11890 [Acidimicrobiia bacterium]|nr:hypothetical protein [Acidimicrobiia bacterium]